MHVKELMTAAPATIKPSDSVREALTKMEDQEIRHLPVVDGSRLVGMVTDRDLREYRLPVMEEIANPDYADGLLATRVADVMNTDLLTVHADEKVRAAIDVMLEYGVGAVPVVDRERGDLLGIVSYVDLLRYARKLLD